MQRRAIVINPTRFYNNTIELIEDIFLNKYLEQGWTIESTTILPSSTAVSSHTIGYKGLASVIYIIVHRGELS